MGLMVLDRLEISMAAIPAKNTVSRAATVWCRVRPLARNAAAGRDRADAVAPWVCRRKPIISCLDFARRIILTTKSIENEITVADSRFAQPGER